MEPTLRILHLEDDPVDSELVHELLAADGLSPRIDRVTTLAEVKAALEHEAYSLIMSDYSIPGMDALEAFRLARQMQPAAPFIFVSGTIAEDLAIETLKQGATDYVFKQRIERLVPAVRRALQEAEEQARRKQVEDALRESEERYRALINASSPVIYRMSPDWSVMIQLRGGNFITDTEEPRRNWLQEYIHPDDQALVMEAIGKAVSSGSAFELEHRVRREDGTYGWTLSRAVPLRNPAGEIMEWFGAANDITERKRAEEALREADRRKDEFLAMLSHELRNPLAPIRNAVQVLRLVGSKEPGAVRQQEIIERQVRHMARLVDDLLDVTRITRGRIELKERRLDLAAVLNHAVEMATPLMEAKRHTFSLTLPPPGNLRVQGDPDRLAQVFGNLLTNAAKYTPEDGRIWMEAGLEDGKAVVRVRDSGLGITPEILPRIFDLFAQADQGLARTQGGLGIGLTIVKRLVQMHGGEVEARSEGPGRGSEFTVRLPVLNEMDQAPREVPAA